MHVAWFGETTCNDVGQVGGKAASLSRLAARHPVPPGFCLTTLAYQTWLTQGSAQPHGLPSGVRDALQHAYAALCEQCGVDLVSVAVRSSAVDEDGAQASFAGQHESYLNISGNEALYRAVLDCWESCRTERALAYRRQHNLSEADVRLAVLVQQLVPADVSAVVFSADPVTGRRDQVMINASWGLGESIVGGTVTPDVFWVDKSRRQVSDRRLGSKERMHVPVLGGTREVPVPRLMRSEPTLSDEQCRQCAALATTLEAEQGHPVDVECAFHKDRLYLLQCRPITRLGG